MAKAFWLITLVALTTADQSGPVTESYIELSNDTGLTMEITNALERLTPSTEHGLTDTERILVISLLVTLSVTNAILIVCVTMICRKNASERTGGKERTVQVNPISLHRVQSSRAGLRLSRKSRLNSRYNDTPPTTTYELQNFPKDTRLLEKDPTPRLGTFSAADPSSGSRATSHPPATPSRRLRESASEDYGKSSSFEQSRPPMQRSVSLQQPRRQVSFSTDVVSGTSDREGQALGRSSQDEYPLNSAKHGKPRLHRSQSSQLRSNPVGETASGKPVVLVHPP